MIASGIPPVATDVRHDNPTIRQLALDYIADLEALVALPYGELVVKVSNHDFVLATVDSELTRKRRKKLAFPAKKG